MSADRHKKIERIRAVQARMHELAEYRMAQLDRQKAELDQDQKDLIGALNEDDSLQGLFVDAMARRLNALARKTEELNQERIAQNRRLVEEGLRLKRTERMSASARRAHEEHVRKKGFETMLQTLARPKDASLP